MSIGKHIALIFILFGLLAFAIGVRVPLYTECRAHGFSAFYCLLQR